MSLHENLPHQPGCYQFKDVHGRIIYIGKAKDLKKRVQSYFVKVHEHLKTQELVKHIYSVDIIITHTETEALLLESKLIFEHKPKYNVHLKDNKRYAYIHITNEQYPRLVTTRIPTGKVFGPYTDGTKRVQTIRALTTLFQLRSCKKMPSKVCLYYHIKRCSGPCEEHINYEEYQQRIKLVEQFLKGDHTQVIEQLEQQMKAFAKEQNYEAAKVVRDQIQGLTYIQEKQHVQDMYTFNQDVIVCQQTTKQVAIMVFHYKKGSLIDKELYTYEHTIDSTSTLVAQFIQQYYQDDAIPSHIIVNAIEQKEQIQKSLQRLCGHAVDISIPQRGVKKVMLDMALKNIHYELLGTNQVLVALQKQLRLPELPIIIECFDISTLQGTHTVASMVQCRDGVMAPSEYRRFKIRTVEGQNDVASMQEVVKRRMSGLLREQKALPHLIVIDGGKGQLHAALQVLQTLQLRIPIIGLAKKQEEIYVPGLARPLAWDHKLPELKLLQRIRDEAHRFAITYHRMLRKQDLKT
ncbi:MAG: excinuclease ABC subunit UvrC [Candidatus Woesearchaeota archaeon]